MKLIAFAERWTGRDEAQLRGEIKRSLTLASVLLPALIALAVLGGTHGVTYGSIALLVTYLIVEQVLKRLRGASRAIDWYFRDP